MADKIDYSYDVGQCVPAEIMVRKKQEIGYVCVSVNRSIVGLAMPQWQAESGLPAIPHRISHMAYGLDYFDGATAVRRSRERGEGWFYFDAGSNGCPIKISTRNLEYALRNLGLLAWKIWDLSIDAELGSRAVRALKGIGVQTIGQLVFQKEADLMDVPGIGQATLLDIEASLEFWSLHLNGGNHQLFKQRWNQAKAKAGGR